MATIYSAFYIIIGAYSGHSQLIALTHNILNFEKLHGVSESEYSAPDQQANVQYFHFHAVNMGWGWGKGEKYNMPGLPVIFQEYVVTELHLRLYFKSGSQGQLSIYLSR